MGSRSQTPVTTGLPSTDSKTAPLHRESYVDDLSKSPSQTDDFLLMPASLQNLSEAEYDSLGRKATWKIDRVVMPILIVMYMYVYSMVLYDCF